MDYIPSNDILQISINIYKLIGETMKYNSIKLNIFRCFNCIILILNMIFTFGSLAYVQGEMYMKATEGGISTTHALIKYVSFLYYKADIESLLDDLKLFWDYRRCGHKLETNIRNIHNNAVKLQKLILLISTCVIVMLCLRPIVNSSNAFIFYCWIPYHSVVWGAICLLAQYYFTILVIPVILACDSVYLSFSIHIISQLRLLNYELTNMRIEDGKEVIHECIKHHQLMLSIFQRMKNIFVWLLLFHYFVTLITGCTQVYIITIGNIKPSELVITALHILALFIQFGYYAFPVDEIVSELKNVSTAIYMSTWVERNVNQKKLLLFMMTRAHQQKYLSIGGIMDMNAHAFASVVRKVFSFYTLLRNILNK